ADFDAQHLALGDGGALRDGNPLNLIGHYSTPLHEQCISPEHSGQGNDKPAIVHAAAAFAMPPCARRRGLRSRGPALLVGPDRRRYPAVARAGSLAGHPGQAAKVGKAHSAIAVCYRWPSGTTGTRWENRKWPPGNPIPA